MSFASDETTAIEALAKRYIRQAGADSRRRTRYVFLTQRQISLWLAADEGSKEGYVGRNTSCGSGVTYESMDKGDREIYGQKEDDGVRL